MKTQMQTSTTQPLTLTRGMIVARMLGHLRESSRYTTELRTVLCNCDGVLITPGAIDSALTTLSRVGIAERDNAGRWTVPMEVQI